MERWPRTIAHADMDAFYASVEQLDNPDLRGKPVLVGPNSDRGVVLTASYEARPSRVGSAMPMALARRRCPDAIIVPPRFERYREISKLIMDVFADFSPVVEALSLDEAFLDMTGSEHIFGEPRRFALRLKAAVAEATGGLSVSVGVSGSKYVAKVASAYRKPDGLTCVEPSAARDWLAPQPVHVLWGAGPKLRGRLAQHRLMTVRDVADADPGWLVSVFGKTGAHLQALARGEDPRAVEGSRESKSLSSEQTFETDVTTVDGLRAHLRECVDKLARRLRKQNHCAYGVRVKLKRSDFRLLNKQARLSEPTQNADRLWETAQALLASFDDGGPYRLVGVAAFDLVAVSAAAQLDLLATTTPRTARLQAVLDELADRFGDGVVQRASTARLRKVGEGDATLDFLNEQEADPPAMD